MLKTVIGRFRIIGICEGWSYILLLFIAMPLKYGADFPLAVTVVGAAHGVLFVLYLLAALHAYFACKWPFWKLAAAGLASLLPFGPFIFDRKLLNTATK